MNRKSLFAVLGVVAVLALVLIAPMSRTHAQSFQGFSDATLQGKYLFQEQGVSTPWGYYAPNSNTFVVITDGVCPVGENCVNSALTKFSFGYMEFDGLGHVTYVSWSGYNPGSTNPTQGGNGFGTYTVGTGGNVVITLDVTQTIGGTGSEQITIYGDAAQVTIPTGGPQVAQAMIVHQYAGGGNSTGDTEAGVAFHQ